jgi:uncharacterized cupredoxin-like copper-binding protein
MRRVSVVVASALAFAVLGTAAAVAAPSSAGTAPTVVNVKLTEMKIVPSRRSVPAGKVTFRVKNVGMSLHELVVIRSNTAPGKLPVKNHEASEAGSVGEVADLHAGKSGTVTLDLKKGKYILICNITGHYQAGMYTGFTVS